MKDGEVIELFKSMIDVNPVVTGYSGYAECFWCGADFYVRRPRIHEPGCQWIQAMDVLGLPHPEHEVQK